MVQPPHRGLISYPQL